MKVVFVKQYNFTKKYIICTNEVASIILKPERKIPYVSLPFLESNGITPSAPPIPTKTLTPYSLASLSFHQRETS